MSQTILQAIGVARFSPDSTLADTIENDTGTKRARANHLRTTNTAARGDPLSPTSLRLLIVIG